MRFFCLRSIAATVSLMMAAAACNPESVGAPAETKETDLTASLLVSAPAAGASSVESIAGATPLVEVDQYSYVSAPPETVEGATVRIRNRTRDHVFGLTTVVEVPIVDGGFDPVAIAASAGDTVEAQFRAEDGSLLMVGTMEVPVRRPPAIVRTVPRGGKKDVPLNTRLEIVFSEPMDLATVTLENVRLTAGGVLVAGTLNFTTNLSVEFVPVEPLAPGTTYDLVVRTGIRNTSGVALENELTVTFQTIISLCSDCALRGSLAFARDEAVFVTNLDGSPAIELLKDASGPVWSRDGSRIAFIRPSSSRLEKWRVCVADHDGSDVRCVTSGEDGIASRPTWSPDGTKIAFTTFVYSCPNGFCGQLGGYYGGLHVLDIVTMQVSTVSTVSLTSVSWSPDGSKIAFSVWGTGTWGRGAFGVMKPDGSEMRILAPALGTYSVNEVAWSPDGSKLALALSNEESCPWDCDTAIGVVNANGTDLKVLATARTADDRYLAAPAWSPDMSRIAYTLDCYALDCRKDVLDVSVAGGDSRVVLTDAAFASWHPARAP